MDIHQLNTDDLARIADDHPLRVAHEMAAGIVTLAVTAATEATDTAHEAAIRGPVDRIVQAAIELRSLGGPPTGY